MRSQCKCIPIGTSSWTLQYSPSLWDYPRVFVEAAPTRGAPLFTLAVSGGWAEKGTVDTQCLLQNAATLPYALGSSDYTALAEEFQETLPVFLDMSWDGTGFLWDTPDLYFLEDPSPTTYTPCPVTIASTTLERELCRTINVNNYAYLTVQAPGNPAYTDGDVETGVGAGPGIIELDASAPFNVVVLVWFTAPTLPTITAPNGNCGTVALALNTYQATCRSGDRRISVSAGGTISEVQVFAEEDLSRSVAYALP